MVSDDCDCFDVKGRQIQRWVVDEAKCGVSRETLKSIDCFT